MKRGEIMSLTTILSELWRFIKDEKIKIFVGSLVISALVIIGMNVVPNLISQPSVSDEGEIDGISKEDMVESREYLTNIYEQTPADFEIFTQMEDGNVFGNSFIFDEYFTSPKIVQEVEEATGVQYSDTLKHETNLELIKDSQYRGSIAGIRNTSSNVITIRVQAGKSSEDNLKLAEAFADMITNNEVPFLENLNTIMLRGPEIGESLIESNLEMVSSPEVLKASTPAETEKNSIILYGVAGFIMGLLLMTALLFIIQLFKEKIDYAFQYSWDFDDYHLLVSENKIENNETLTGVLSSSVPNDKKIISQERSFINRIEKLNEEMKIINVSSRLTFDTNKPKNIVIIIESNKTDKEWYNEQYRLAELFNTQITIIHLL
jgi:uncharacterized protein (UPF0335 family)